MTKWISVKDRLPNAEERDLLLCQTYERSGKTYHAYYTGALELWDDGFGSNTNCWNIDGEYYWHGEDFDRITHWAKIEPPEVTE